MCVLRVNGMDILRTDMVFLYFSIPLFDLLDLSSLWITR